MCLFIGTTSVGWSLAENETVKLSTSSALQLCTLLYVTIVAGVAVMGTFIRWMSRAFEARPTLNQCIGFAAYTVTPFFIAGIAGLYPSRWLAIIVLGAASVYSTFLLHAKRAAARFGLSARDILVELGRKKMIGGQEDMIEDTAMTMARERGLLRAAA